MCLCVLRITIEGRGATKQVVSLWEDVCGSLGPLSLSSRNSIQRGNLFPLLDPPPPLCGNAPTTANRARRGADGQAPSHQAL